MESNGTWSTRKRCCEPAHEFAADKAIERSPAFVILDLSIPILDSVETTSAVHRTVPGIKTTGLAIFSTGELRGTVITAAGFEVIVNR